MKRIFLGLLMVSLPITPASAISISLVYQNPSDTFFTSEAQQTLNKAAADVSFAINMSLAAVSQDIYTGTNGSTTATVNWALSYTNPTDGTTTVPLEAFSLVSNEIRVYVGSRVIAGDTLGVGGPGGVGLSINPSGSPSGWQGAVSNMEAVSNAGMTRGGPEVGIVSGTVPYSGTPATFNLAYGYSIGSVAFNSSASWHFGYDTLPAAGQSDFYTVAVHEILHELGFGTGLNWNDNASDQDWTGSAVIGLLGSGNNTLSDDLSHVAEGLTGHPLIDGVFNLGLTQEALMSPTATEGTRKYITDLDLAFMQDSGWTVATVPEPSTYLLLGWGLGFLFLYRRRLQVKK